MNDSVQLSRSEFSMILIQEINLLFQYHDNNALSQFQPYHVETSPLGKCKKRKQIQNPHALRFLG